MIDLLKGYSTHNKKAMPIEKWLKGQDKLRENKKYQKVYKDAGLKIPNTKL